MTLFNLLDQTCWGKSNDQRVCCCWNNFPEAMALLSVLAFADPDTTASVFPAGQAD